MSTSVRSPGVWVLKIVRPDTGAPAPGVPVTLLDDDDTPLGHWVSDREGVLEIPRQEAGRIRLRVGLRTEEPFEVLPGELRRGALELPAPRSLLPAPASAAGTDPARVELAEQPELPPQVLQFSRLGVLAPQPSVTVQERVGLAATPAPDPVATTGLPPVDFFSVAVNYPAPLRYGILVELEQHWLPLGYALGDLLYSVALAPGDEARVAVLDGRRRNHEEAEQGVPEELVPRERPLQELARLVGARALVGVLGEASGALPLEPFTVVGVEPSAQGSLLGAAAADAVRYLNDRAVRVSGFVRSRRAFGVTEVREGADRTAAVRVVRNTHPDRAAAYQYYETLQRFRVTSHAQRVRPAILVPFRMPNLATSSAVRQYGYLFRRALLDRTLLPELDRLLGLAEPRGVDAVDAEAPISELRLVAQVAAGDRALDLWQASCYLHVDSARYAVHFTPAEAPEGGVSGATIPRTTHWIGAIRPAAFHAQPLKYPGQLGLENGSLTDLMFETLHVEGRAGEAWKRLFSFRDLALTAESRMQLMGLGLQAGVPGGEVTHSRLLAHIAANLPYYSAAVIAGGDPALRYLALSKVRDSLGRVIADIIENTVVGVAGNYVAFPLRSGEYAPPDLQAIFAAHGDRPPAASDEVVVTIPTPGVWLRTVLSAALESAVPVEPPEEVEPGGGSDHSWPAARSGWRPGRRDRAAETP